ncbi:MAG: PD40 domain-containing protein [Bacteroidales bacterium]|nr:PD40 domain-containing protein [Bacteroidales bacterium]
MKRILTVLAALLPLLAFAADRQEARLLRFPAVGGDNIVFSYAGDLYRVGIDGGTAQKLTSHVGYEVFPRISPDGRTVAFTGQYDGNTEVYTIPVTGGEPRRVTWSALVGRDMVGERMGPNNIVMCWTPDGKQIVYRSKTHTFSGLRGQLCKVDAEGGPAVEIPTTEGGFCSYSPDGRFLAMNRMFREFRTWKYYRGGQADDIWINRVGTTQIDKITDNDAQDIFPMWIGDEIYYLSDRDRTMNLFVFDTKTEKTRKVTDFTEYDCKFPSYSQDYVVFENGGYIYKYDVKARKCEKVTIYLDSDNIYSRPEYKNVADKMFAFDLSPDGERVLIIARGELFSLPAHRGPVNNLTQTPGGHEREGRWSPDGKHIAWFSDKDGEYQVYVAPSGNPANAKAVTSFKDGYPSNLQWAPDSKSLYFSTLKREIYNVDIESNRAKAIIGGQAGSPRGFTLSADGSWAAYSMDLDNEVSAIFLYDVATGKSYQVTDRWYDASSPVFSQDGKYLFFTSSRDFRSQYSRVEWNASYNVNDYVFVVPLAKDTPDPTTLTNDEYGVKKPGQAGHDGKGKPGDGKDVTSGPDRESKATMKVDVEGIGQRASVLPLPAGRYRLILAENDKLYYSSFGGMMPGMGGGPRGGAGAAAAVKILDLKTLKTSDGPKNVPVAFTPDHKKCLVREGGKLYVTGFGGPAKLDEPVPTTEMDMIIDHEAEWKQIYDESWRVTRDNFYVENMHGIDWNKIHDKYAVMLPYVKHRHDLTYLIGEMISELTVGHAYITSGEVPEIPRVATGLLGGKFSKDAKTGAFRIDHIYKGASWDKSLVSPLDGAGINAKVGQYITNVNGTPASELKDIYEALVGKAGKTVSLVIAETASGNNARTVYVKPVANESQLAYYEWVQKNIEKVDKASNGQIGYIHIPDMSTEGLDMFTKLFYTQLDKKALIIDDRMNGGGNVSPMILERLQREVYRMTMSRNGGRNSTVPEATFYGPKVCLIDKYSSSDGDLFPYGFRKLGLGKLIGKRSWGGIVGISGSRAYLDGQDMRTPFFTSYSTEGQWIIEGHGVDPDIDIDINPFEDYVGKDAQLDKAIEVLKAELKNWPELPGTPNAPDKSRIGLK